MGITASQIDANRIKIALVDRLVDLFDSGHFLLNSKLVVMGFDYVTNEESFLGVRAPNGDEYLFSDTDNHFRAELTTMDLMILLNLYELALMNRCKEKYNG